MKDGNKAGKRKERFKDKDRDRDGWMVLAVVPVPGCLRYYYDSSCCCIHRRGTVR